jgi:hypothetical protein
MTNRVVAYPVADGIIIPLAPGATMTVEALQALLPEGVYAIATTDDTVTVEGNEVLYPPDISTVTLSALIVTQDDPFPDVTVVMADNGNPAIDPETDLVTTWYLASDLNTAVTDTSVLGNYVVRVVAANSVGEDIVNQGGLTVVADAAAAFPDPFTIEVQQTTGTLQVEVRIPATIPVEAGYEIRYVVGLLTPAQTVEADFAETNTFMRVLPDDAVDILDAWVTQPRGYTANQTSWVRAVWWDTTLDRADMANMASDSVVIAEVVDPPDEAPAQMTVNVHWTATSTQDGSGQISISYLSPPEVGTAPLASITYSLNGSAGPWITWPFGLSPNTITAQGVVDQAQSIGFRAVDTNGNQVAAGSVSYASRTPTDNAAEPGTTVWLETTGNAVTDLATLHQLYQDALRLDGDFTGADDLRIIRIPPIEFSAMVSFGPAAGACVAGEVRVIGSGAEQTMFVGDAHTLDSCGTNTSALKVLFDEIKWTLGDTGSTIPDSIGGATAKCLGLGAINCNELVFGPGCVIRGAEDHMPEDDIRGLMRFFVIDGVPGAGFAAGQTMALNGYTVPLK